MHVVEDVLLGSVDVEGENGEGDEEHEEKHADLVLDELEVKNDAWTKSVQLGLRGPFAKVPAQSFGEDVFPSVKGPISRQRPSRFFEFLDLFQNKWESGKERIKRKTSRKRRTQLKYKGDLEREKL